MAWPSTNPSASTPTGTEVVQPPTSVPAQVMEQAAEAAGLSPPVGIDPAADVGGGHGIGRGTAGLVPEALSPEQLAHTVQTAEASATVGGSASPTGGVSAELVAANKSAHKISYKPSDSAWLPSRNGRRVYANGNSGLAPLTQVLPPPWEQNSRAEWLDHSTQLASKQEIAALDLPLLSDQDTAAIGRWGEELVAKHFASAGTPCEWVNEEAESGLPFDIRLQLETQTVYVEVKSTVSTSRHVFPISGQELSCAQDNRGSYW